MTIKNLEMMEEDDLPGRSARMSEELHKMLSGHQRHPNVGELQSKGLIGVEMMEGKQTQRPASSEMVNSVAAACKSQGLILDGNAHTVAGFDNSIPLALPPSLTDEDLEVAAGVLV